MKYFRFTQPLVLPMMAVGLLTTGIFSANAAFARPHGACPYMDDGKNVESKISDEQRKAARGLVDAAHDTFAQLRHELFIKKNELKALHNSAFPDVNAVGAKAKEITELRQKMQEEQQKLGAALDKALGLEPGTHDFKRGMHTPHRRGCGMGEMKGHGMKGHGGPYRGHKAPHKGHGGGMHQQHTMPDMQNNVPNMKNEENKPQEEVKDVQG